ncbi:hypothetical protein RJ640_021146 [Escallonia rubra]|uniref:Uncharacterized protein n=1 Tax=Escallonia rubra TaxID=112253 RepID=A0AA88RSJ4_9ASTE|nr:hypothetical protein RJ640_021146 [Escallonia rubra]
MREKDGVHLRERGTLYTDGQGGDDEFILEAKVGDDVKYQIGVGFISGHHVEHQRNCKGAMAETKAGNKSEDEWDIPESRKRKSRQPNTSGVPENPESQLKVQYGDETYSPHHLSLLYLFLFTTFLSRNRQCSELDHPG